MESYHISDIFTPTSVADINFIERNSLNTRISSALHTKGKQIVIFGHSGVGKTTLLRKSLQRIYEKEIFSHCMIGMTFESLVLDAFDQLSEYYLDMKLVTDKSVIKAQLTSSYLLIKSAIDVSRESSGTDNFKRIVGVQLTAQRLADFLGEADCCWILEDFHKIDVSEKNKLSQIMKVFMDKSIDYPKLKIIALGAVNTGREVVEYDIEMRNRVSEIEVQLMTNQELREIINNGEKFLNIKFHESTKKEIIEFSNGLASICHAICLYICEEAGIITTMKEEKITLLRKDLSRGITRYMEEESDSLKYKFDIAFNQNNSKFDNTKLILRALLNFESDGANSAELLRFILDEEPNYTRSLLMANLRKLQEENKGGLVKFDNYSGKYSFSMPLYNTFAIAYFSKIDSQIRNINVKSLKNSIGRMAYDLLVDLQMKKYIH